MKLMTDEKLWIGGVCSGIAYYLKITTWLVRVLFFLTSALFPLYIALWICCPKMTETPKNYNKVCE